MQLSDHPTAGEHRAARAVAVAFADEHSGLLSHPSHTTPELPLNWCLATLTPPVAAPIDAEKASAVNRIVDCTSEVTHNTRSAGGGASWEASPVVEPCSMSSTDRDDIARTTEQLAAQA